MLFTLICKRTYVDDNHSYLTGYYLHWFVKGHMLMKNAVI